MKTFPTEFLTRQNRNRIVIPATRLRRSASPRREAGIQAYPPLVDWIPIFMGMTNRKRYSLFRTLSFSIFHLAISCLLLVSLSACQEGELASKNAGQIYVTTDPDGASLFCDAASCGSTPATISPVAPGDHMIVARKAGYRETRESVTTKAGERLAVELKLEPLRGLVLICSIPSEANIELDGANIGQTPFFSHDFPPGQSRLQITKPGYITKTININIEDRTPVKVEANLTSDSAELVVESTPSGATVSMDNAPIGTTPLNLASAKTGKHVVEVSLKGHSPARYEIALQAGEKQKVAAALQPLPGKLTVISDPPKARIYLNNQFKIEAPFSVTNIPSGQYAIRAELQGYDPLTQNQEVTFGGETTVEMRLVKSSGTAIITTLPSDVNVYLDGEFRGTTKTRGRDQISDQLQIDYIPKGRHQLQLTRKNYIDIQRAFEVMPKQTVIIHEKLVLRPVPFVPDIIVRTGDKPEQTFRGILRDTFANGDLKVEIQPGIFKTFSKDEIISKETIPPAR